MPRYGNWCTAVLTALCVSAAASGAEPAKAPSPPVLEARLRPLASLPTHGPFVRVGDGSIVCVKGDTVMRSRDEGATWEGRPMFEGLNLKARPEQALVRTRDGTIVLLFLNELDKQWKWNKELNGIEGEAWCYTWAARSTDGGESWTDIHQIQDGYAGAVRDVIQTRNGNLVAPLQRFLPDAMRHATPPGLSLDDGRTWRITGLLDTGGRGHHDGAIEASVVELEDGRLWMLLRTSLDCFWQSYSDDQGETWEKPTPTTIDASSSPGMVKRLASGRLMLAWNRLYPEGKTEVRRLAGQHSEAAASWFRDELSIAFSDDEGKAWSEPVVVGRGKRIAYPYIFEREPGVVWLTTMQGGLRAELREADFVSGSADASGAASAEPR